MSYLKELLTGLMITKQNLTNKEGLERLKNQSRYHEILLLQKFNDRNAILSQKLFGPAVRKTFEIREFENFLRSLEQFIPVKGQNNFGNRVLF